MTVSSCDRGVEINIKERRIVKMKKIVSVVLVFFMIFSLTEPALASEEAPVSSFCIAISKCTCGEDPQENPPDGYIYSNEEETEEDDYEPAEFSLLNQ